MLANSSPALFVSVIRDSESWGRVWGVRNRDVLEEIQNWSFWENEVLKWKFYCVPRKVGKTGKIRYFKTILFFLGKSDVLEKHANWQENCFFLGKLGVHQAHHSQTTLKRRCINVVYVETTLFQRHLTMVCPLGRNNNYVTPGKKGVLTDVIFIPAKIKCCKKLCNLLANRVISVLEESAVAGKSWCSKIMDKGT